MRVAFTQPVGVCVVRWATKQEKKNREKDGGTRKTDKNINKIPAINVFLPLTNVD